MSPWVVSMSLVMWVRKRFAIEDSDLFGVARSGAFSSSEGR